MYELLKTDFFEMHTGHKPGTVPNSDYECCLLQMVRAVLPPVRLHTGLHHGGRTFSAGGR